MLDRRRLLTLLGLSAGFAGSIGRIAGALADEPRIVPADPNLQLQSAATGRRDNCSFVADMRSTLRRDVDAGLALPDCERVVMCPLCRDQIVVKAYV
jgi:hypothetical protein